MAIAKSATGTGKNNVPPALLNPDSYNVILVTAADTVDSIAIPDGAEYCVFSSVQDFWADIATISASVNPAVESTDGTSAVLNPAGFNNLSNFSSIFVKSATIAYIGIQFFSQSGQAV